MPDLRPPWVSKKGPGEKDIADGYLGENYKCQDLIGHGRIPLSWWTKNLAYNKAYEIHRLNTHSKVAKEAVSGETDTGSSTRFDETIAPSAGERLENSRSVGTRGKFAPVSAEEPGRALAADSVTKLGVLPKRLFEDRIGGSHAE